MKNPTEPNLKTEAFPFLMLVISLLAAFYFRSSLPRDLVVSWDDYGKPLKTVSWTFLAYLWPLVLAFIYGMFLFFPYFRINHQESASLKEQWHKAKELSLSFFLCLQVVAGLLLSGDNKILLWALPILFILLLVSFIPTIIRIFKHRKKHPIKYGR